jgi:hypothetical protein
LPLLLLLLLGVVACRSRAWVSGVGCPSHHHYQHQHQHQHSILAMARAAQAAVDDIQAPLEPVRLLPLLLLLLSLGRMGAGSREWVSGVGCPPQQQHDSLAAATAAQAAADHLVIYTGIHLLLHVACSKL